MADEQQIMGDSDIPGTQVDPTSTTPSSDMSAPDPKKPFDWKKLGQTLAKGAGNATIAAINSKSGGGAPGTQHGQQLGSATPPAPVPMAARTMGSTNYQPSDPSTAFGR